MTHYVFLGPSLPLASALGLHPDAVFLPPVAQGDLYTLVQTRAQPGDVVAIVDGLFEQVPAVWHKEVLYALQEGVHVWGASSMGALRAAELQDFGMKPVGRIAEAFARGDLEDDDEVVVAHATGEQGFRCLSQAMVSLRWGLHALRDGGRLDAATCDALVAHAKALHYSERSWGAVMAQARSLARSSAEINALREQAGRPDAKALDAMQLLQQLASTPKLPPFEPAFTLERTAFWQALVHTQHLRQAGPASAAAPDANEQAVLTHARALDPQRHLWRQQALLLRLLEERSAGESLPDAELQAAARRLAYRHGLRTTEALRAWREEQALDASTWQTLLRREALLARELAARGPLLAQDEVLALRQQGRFGMLRRRVAQAQQSLRERGMGGSPALADVGLDADTLQSWYEARLGPMLPTPEHHARSLGFESLREFVDELTRQQLADQDAAPAR